MKIGDKVYHRHMPGIATVIRVDIQQNYDVRKKKNTVKSEYTAVYPDGTPITFYGFNIGKTVFKSEPISQQLSLFDSIEN